MKRYSKNIIQGKKSIKEALEALNLLEAGDSMTLFVVDDNQALVGTLTDGDVRRGLLAGKNISDKLEEIMRKNFRFLQRNKFDLLDIDRLRKEELTLIPLLDENKKIIRIVDLKEKRSVLPLDVLIMAGGEGRRLRPLTLDLPKPLLTVGTKPIVEHNIDRLNSYGIDNVWLYINYLAPKIKNYFKDGSDKGINIHYINEEEFLGTLGSITLVDNFIHDHIIVMNSDLLTNIDFEDFYRVFIDSNADMAVASVPYSINIPYAVIETVGQKVTSLKEKPTYTYYSNAGIYLIKKELIKLMPQGKFFNATDLMEMLIEKGMNLVYYPVLGYWLDIGQPEDYKKAQEDIKHIKL